MAGAGASLEKVLDLKESATAFRNMALASGLQLQTMHREICSLRSSVKQILLVVVLYYYDYKI